ARAALAPAGRRALRADEDADGGGRFSRCRSERARRHPRRLPGRLWPGAGLQHHAGAGDALRGRRRGGAGAHRGAIPGAVRARPARSDTAILTMSNYIISPSILSADFSRLGAEVDAVLAA